MGFAVGGCALDQNKCAQELFDPEHFIPDDDESLWVIDRSTDTIDNGDDCLSAVIFSNKVTGSSDFYNSILLRFILTLTWHEKPVT